MSQQTEDFEYSNTTNGACERVLVMLGDAQKGKTNRRWSESLVKTAVRDALCLVSLLAPRSVTSTHTWMLEANTCYQAPPEGCDSVVEIGCIRDLVTGLDITVTDATDDSVKKAASYPSGCASGCDSSISNLTIASVNDSNYFRIDPVVTDSDRYEVTGLCTTAGALLDPRKDCDEWPRSLKGFMLPVTQLASAMLLLRNSSDANALSLANAYLSQFSLATSIALSDVQNALARGDA